jgi:hypothetical protein
MLECVRVTWILVSFQVFSLATDSYKQATAGLGKRQTGSNPHSLRPPPHPSFGSAPTSPESSSWHLTVSTLSLMGRKGKGGGGGGKSSKKFIHAVTYNPKARESDERRFNSMRNVEIKRLQARCQKHKGFLTRYISPKDEARNLKTTSL